MDCGGKLAVLLFWAAGTDSSKTERLPGTFKTLAVADASLEAVTWEGVELASAMTGTVFASCGVGIAVGVATAFTFGIGVGVTVAFTVGVATAFTVGIGVGVTVAFTVGVGVAFEADAADDADVVAG